jgi:hypothetical protein
MEINIEDYNGLYDLYIEDSTIVFNCCKNYSIKIIESKFKSGINTYVIENHFGILNKLSFNYTVNYTSGERSYFLYIKILNSSGSPIFTPYNLYSNNSYINIDDLENYLRWYAPLEEMYLLGHTTLDDVSNT